MNVVSYFIQDNKDIALVDGSDIFSYKELKERSLRLANSLIKREEINPGDKIVLLAHTSSEFVIAYLAILATGAIVIPLDPHLKDSELARDISYVQPKLIITSSESWIPQSISEKYKTIEFHSSTWRKYLWTRQSKIIDRDENDIAVMMMTSGSSFQPRPAMLSHKSLLTNLNQAYDLDKLKLDKTDVVLGALPLYHIFGLHVVLGFTLFCKATIVLSRTFDPVELAALIKNKNITVVPGVPAIFEAFIREELVDAKPFGAVRMFLSGGAPMRSDVRQAFENKFSHHISEGYGLTEASPMISFSERPEIEGDLGVILKGIELEIRDSSGAVALAGDVGQIVVKGDNIFSGYYKDVRSTKTVLDENGWLYTGDIGVKNDDGQIILIDRSSDVIVVSGFSVFPSEVEATLLKHELVNAVSVEGELNNETGETPIAYVVLNVGELDQKSKRIHEKALREFCSDNLARYKIPSKFVFVEELSLKASGRPLRKSLRSAISSFEKVLQD